MHLATLLTLPLLAAAVPTSPLVVQAEDGMQAVFGGGGKPYVPAAGSASGAQASSSSDFTLDLDLNELRLVQFAEDEPPR